MKIAFFSDCFLDLTGGITSSIKAQKMALEKNGHEVYVFSTGYPKTKSELEKLAEQNIYMVPSCKWCLRGLTPVSRRPGIVERWLVREHPEIRNFDIYYVHYEAGCSIAGLRLGKKLGIPTVQVMHGREDAGLDGIIPFGLKTVVAGFLDWFHSWYIPHPIKVRRDHYLANTIAKAKMWTIMVNHANYADYVITPSRHFAKKLEYYGVKKEIMVLPNGYLDVYFPKDAQIKTLKEGEELRMVWHSRVSSEKRIMAFLEALTKLKCKYRLDVYGGGGDLKRAKKYTKLHQLNVGFYGEEKFEKIAQAITKAHLDILVSFNFDTFGMTLIEAEAAGVPVLICDPDMKEVVPEGGYILSASEKPEDMARALNELAAHPDKIQEMSEIMVKNRKEVLVSKRIKLLENIFNDIMKK